MSDWAGIKYALNSTLGTEEFQSLDKLFGTRLSEWMSVYQNNKYTEFTTAGAHRYVVPDGVYKLYIAACGGGAGGTGAAGDRYTSLDRTNGAGGGGGEAVLNYKILVNPGDVLNITVGNGGSGGVTSDNPTAGTDGGDTVIDNYITLKGGKAGAVVDTGAQYRFTGGAAGGPGGGKGGNTGAKGGDGIIGSGGKPANSSYAGGGGGSIGGGGFPSGYQSYNYIYTPPTRGGGGAGGGNASSNAFPINGQKGASGYVMISVVEITESMINGTAASASAASYTTSELMTAYREGVESIG